MLRAALFTLLLASPAVCHAKESLPARIAKRLGLRSAGPTQLPPLSRIHILTTELLGRLSAPAQRNFLSLAGYSGPNASGSGVVVGAWSTERKTVRALVLTADHVVKDNFDGTGQFTLGAEPTPQSRAKIVARSRVLDYALVEVEVPEHEAQIVPAKVAAHWRNPGTKLYGMGARTSMTAFPVDEFVAGSKAERADVKRQVRAGSDQQYTIGSGRVGPGAGLVRNTLGTRSYLAEDDVPSAPGSSGGPLFDRATHELVGIRSTGDRLQHQSYGGHVETGYILTDVMKQHARGLIARDSEDLVYSLLVDTGIYSKE